MEIAVCSKRLTWFDWAYSPINFSVHATFLAACRFSLNPHFRIFVGLRLQIWGSFERSTGLGLFNVLALLPRSLLDFFRAFYYIQLETMITYTWFPCVVKCSSWLLSDAYPIFRWHFCLISDISWNNVHYTWME